jgi:hypothetical protein
VHRVHGVLIALRLEIVEITTKAWDALYDTLIRLYTVSYVLVGVRVFEVSSAEMVEPVLTAPVRSERRGGR